MRRTSANTPSYVWLALLGCVLALFGTHVGRYWDFTVDDAGISYAYARHLANGHGLVMTPGAERVEAATNLLWILLLTPAKWIGVDHEPLSKFLGLFFSSGALALVAMFPAVAYKRRPRYFDLVAPLIAAMMPHYAMWSVAGLENGLFSCMAAAALLALAHEENEPSRFPWSAVFLVLLFATRPDGLLYCAAAGAAKLLRKISPRPPRQDLVWGIVLAAGIGGLELFRLAYFAWPWPNSFYTKRRTFQFGQDLFDTRTAGWTYVGQWLQQYKLTHAVYFLPLILVGLRAPVARVAAFGFVCAAFFFPIYSHGDWMEEHRFLTYGVPFITLCLAEGARAVARVVQLAVPKSARRYVAFALTPVAAYLVVAETTRYYPERIRTVMSHSTLEFAYVRGRARYFTAAARRLNIGRGGSLLDPDVGGSSYEGTLQVVDMFGLGDIPIAHTHPDNPPGTREAIFWERRPTFIHLHGAWFAAMELSRLEEMEQGYLRLPGRMPTGESEPDANWVRRESIAAPWYLTAETAPPAGIARTGMYVAGYTVSHHAMEPGRRFMVDVLVAGATGGQAGSVMLQPFAGGRAVEASAEISGGLIAPATLYPGERPRARVELRPATGRYHITYRAPGGQQVTLGDLEVGRGAGARESAALRDQLSRELSAGRYGGAGRIARTLGLRVTADATDAAALDGLSRYGMALVERARVLATDGRAYQIAARLAREGRAWAAHDGRVIARADNVAETLADAARAAERRRSLAESFVLAREAVLTDPRRSWARRRAEELRPRRVQEYDGGRDQTAYHMAASALAGTVPMDRALILLGEVERYTEAAQLAEMAGHTPVDERARVVVARGQLARGDATAALALVSGVPCAGAHDPELSRGLRAVLGHAYRPGDSACEAELPRPAAPFDPGDGSFEAGSWGGWTVTGDAFGPRPSHDHPSHQWFVNGWNGWHFANSYVHNNDEHTGTLRSRPFTVQSEGISFLVGGGSDAEHVGVRLVVGGVAVLRTAGNNTEGLRRVFWDVRQFVGQRATIEVYDESNGGWGHVLADDFRLEAVVPDGMAQAPAPPAATPAASAPAAGAPGASAPAAGAPAAGAPAAGAPGASAPAAGAPAAGATSATPASAAAAAPATSAAGGPAHRATPLSHGAVPAAH